jgi:NAD(P)H-nitrite reductase large subunit
MITHHVLRSSKYQVFSALQKARVELAANGRVMVNEQLRTSSPHIWAVGDVVGRRELTPVALMEGMAFAGFCFGKRKDEVRRLCYSSIPSAVRILGACFAGGGRIGALPAAYTQQYNTNWRCLYAAALMLFRRCSHTV